MSTKQSVMFETEDLPLFSRTAQRVKVNEYKAQPPEPKQLTFRCPLCGGTGFLSGRWAFCPCPTGQERAKESTE